MKKAKLEMQETRDGIDFLIKNFSDLNIQMIKKLEEFALKRNGYFRYDLQQFGIRRKLDKKQILQIFELLEIETEIVNTIVMDEDDSIKNQIVDFGKHKGDRWCDIPLNYLKWLYYENQNGFAYAEIKRRRYAPPDIENTTIHIGKYRGEKWINIPTYYLEWILTKFEKELKMEDEYELCRFAKAVLNKRIQ